MFQIKVVDKIKTRTLNSTNFIFENRVVYEIMWKNILEPGRPHMTIWRMCISSWVSSARNTLTVCNAYCFSIETMVAKTCLNITLHVLCLSGCAVAFIQGYRKRWTGFETAIT